MGRRALLMLADGIVLAALAAGQSDPIPAPAGTEWLVGDRAETGDRFVTRDGVRIALASFQAPEASAEGTAPYRGAFAAQLRLHELVRGARLSVVTHLIDPHGVRLATVRGADGRSLAEILLEEGLGRPLFGLGDGDAQALESAQRRGRERRMGVHAGPRAPRTPPNIPEGRILGVALGLHSQDPRFDYGPLLDQIQLVGASHVLLVVPRFLEDHRATQIFAVPHRTA